MAEDGPLLPPGRELELPGRGVTFVREVAGPPGAPAVVLLHGWTVTADLNWYTAFDALGSRFRVVALDQRGHGLGIRSKRSFRLEDCADDAAAAMQALGIDQVVAVGYSMGGPVAQLLWRRHRSLVTGMVLCATARSFASTNEERLWFAGVGGLAVATRWAPSPARQWFSQRLVDRKARGWEQWAATQVSRHEWRTILEAGYAIGQFSSIPWIAEVDVPAAVVVTTRDQVVPPRRQRRLAESIPGALVYPVDADHGAPVRAAERFVPALVDACRAVTTPVAADQADPRLGA